MGCFRSFEGGNTCNFTADCTTTWNSTWGTDAKHQFGAPFPSEPHRPARSTRVSRPQVAQRREPGSGSSAAGGGPNVGG